MVSACAGDTFIFLGDTKSPKIFTLDHTFWPHFISLPILGAIAEERTGRGNQWCPHMQQETSNLHTERMPAYGQLNSVQNIYAATERANMMWKPSATANTLCKVLFLSSFQHQSCLTLGLRSSIQKSKYKGDSTDGVCPTRYTLVEPNQPKIKWNHGRSDIKQIWFSFQSLEINFMGQLISYQIKSLSHPEASYE